MRHGIWWLCTCTSRLWHHESDLTMKASPAPPFRLARRRLLWKILWEAQSRMILEKCDWVRRAHWWVWPQEGQLSVYIVSVVLLGSCGAGQKAADIKGYSPQVETSLSECASNVVLATVPWHLLTYLYLSHLPKVSYMSRAFASALRVRIRSLAYTAFAWLCD